MHEAVCQQADALPFLVNTARGQLRRSSAPETFEQDCRQKELRNSIPVCQRMGVMKDNYSETSSDKNKFISLAYSLVFQRSDSFTSDVRLSKNSAEFLAFTFEVAPVHC